MRSTSRGRRGSALPVVVVLTAALLLVASALADGVWRATRAARLGWQGERATHSADAALLGAAAAWLPVTATALRVGETDTIHASGSAEERTLVVRSRLSARAFALEATSQIQDGGVRAATRRVGRALLLDWPTVPGGAALASAGAVAVGAASTVLGADAVPAGWDAECSSDQRTTPSIALLAASATVDGAATVAGWGTPFQMLPTPAVPDLAGELDAVMAQVLAAATVVTADSLLSLDDLAGSPACPRLLGDARRTAGAHPTCTRRWPVVATTHPGETVLSGSTPAQGVLLVAGDLRIDGPVRFSGVLLVGGRLLVPRSAGTTVRSELVGTTLVRDRGALGSGLDGPVLLQASRCAARLALAALGAPVPQAEHGWTLRP